MLRSRQRTRKQEPAATTGGGRTPPRPRDIKDPSPAQGPVSLFSRHTSESVDIQLWEEQQTVNQEPQEEDEIHQVRLLHQLRQGVAVRAVRPRRRGFARVVGLPG